MKSPNYLWSLGYGMAGPTVDFWKANGEPLADLLLCPDFEGKNGLDGSKEISPAEAVALAHSYFTSGEAEKHGPILSDMKALKRVCSYFMKHGLNENNRRK
jgi:hypothetical protein